jgi:short-subunit dehydrogenase
MMDRWRGKWAVVTGASAGIGTALARLLAAGGTNLVLTARRRERLEKLAAELAAANKIQVEIVAADLERTEAPGELYGFTTGKGIDVDLLINNAGFGHYGTFHQSPLEPQLGMVQVNCAAVVQLTHFYLPGMVKRRRGDILILASTASFQAVPYISVYAASKAFDLLFAEGLAEEVRAHGVQVCALCPGSTTTEFHQVAGQPDHLKRRQETPEKVARVGLEALAAGKSYVISGFANYASTQAERLVPRGLVTRVAGKMFAPK